MHIDFYLVINLKWTALREPLETKVLVERRYVSLSHDLYDGKASILQDH